MPKGVPGSVGEHGTANRYSNHGCRCSACREAWRVYLMERRRRKGVRPAAEYHAELRARPIRHGMVSGYKRGCRCDACKTASATARQRHREENAEHQREYDRAYKAKRRAAAGVHTWRIHDPSG